MTKFEQRLETLIMMVADPNITIIPSEMEKIKENLLASAKNELWRDAQGDDLPEIDREVIVLCDDVHGGYKVCFGHRPNKKGYLGKSLVTGNVETFYPHTYDKGGWNIPNVKWWLDLNLPNKEEQE